MWPEADGRVGLEAGRRWALSETGSEPGRAAGDPDLSPDERTELERLRAENADLRRQQAHAIRRHRMSWRTPVATVLIVIGCLLAPVSVLGVWTANQVSDTS